MAIFLSNKHKGLKKIDKKSFATEEEIHLLVEENLHQIFGLDFISGKINSQFRIKGFVLDTLAFDPETKSFVIIEYKKDESFSVVDQGMNYLSLMLNNKAEFILEYNEHVASSIKRPDVDWSQSRVVFVAPKFTPYQIGATAFKDFPIELWEVTLYEGGLVEFDLVEVPETSESVQKIIKGKKAGLISSQIKDYRIEDLIKTGWKKTRGLFDVVDDLVLRLQFPGSQRKILKYYISYFYPGEPSFLEVVPQESGIRLYIRQYKKDLPKNSGFLFYDCSEKGRWTNGNTFFKATTDSEILGFIKFLRNLIKHP